MYARNLERKSVRASPSHTSSIPKYSDLLRNQNTADENSYRYRIPPGYDGNRFSRYSPEPDTKHHTADQGDVEITENRLEKRSRPLPPIDESEGFLPRSSESNTEDMGSESACIQKAEPSPPADTLTSFLASLKDRIEGEDILLVVIILILASGGENAEVTLLLLSILLLVK